MPSLRDRAIARGIKRTTAIASIAASGMSQHTKENDEDLASVLELYGVVNQVTITNSSACKIRIDLDHVSGKRHIIPAGSAISISDEDFLGYTLFNLDTVSATGAGTVTVVLIVENPVLTRNVGVKKGTSFIEVG